jgi:hypothetical protein
MHGIAHAENGVRDRNLGIAAPVPALRNRAAKSVAFLERRGRSRNPRYTRRSDTAVIADA